MSGLTYLNIMTSKILIGLTESSLPCIRVNMPGVVSDDLRDQVVKLFFEKLEHESPFVGVVNNPAQEVAELVPLNIPSALEWLEKFFVNNKVDNTDNGIKVLTAFKELRSVYFDYAVSDDNTEITSAVKMILDRKASDKENAIMLNK